MNDEVVNLAGISPSWLANELDTRGVVRLRDVFSDEWLAAMRASISDYISANGDRDVFIAEADHEVHSPPHQIVSNPVVRQLFSDTAARRRPYDASGDDVIRCSMLVRAGTELKARSRLFHYDSCVLTMVVPILIPKAEFGTCGELAAFGNKRPFRRFVIPHLIETILTHNSLYRRYATKLVYDAPEKYVVQLEPGDAYLFWGYRTFHGNLDCGPGLVRATLVLHYGPVHSQSKLLSLVWRFSRSRRDLRRLQRVPADA